MLNQVQHGVVLITCRVSCSSIGSWRSGYPLGQHAELRRSTRWSYGRAQSALRPSTSSGCSVSPSAGLIGKNEAPGVSYRALFRFGRSW